MIKKDGPILLLTWASGCLDALSYVGLGQVFVANMTGNTVLFGLAIAQGDQLTILRSLTALLGFALGAMCSAFLVERNYERPRGTWTPRVVLALAIEACLLLIFALVWLLAKHGPQVNLIIYLLIVISALAVGQQSAVVTSLGVPGVSTTYITGTITTLMTAIGRRLFIHTQEPPTVANTVDAQIEQQKPVRLAFVWLIYIVAAIVTGTGLIHFSALVVFLPLIAVVAAILSALPRQSL
jgi:uncharacterized membrane protein YoaK (UPF0700 family)